MIRQALGRLTAALAALGAVAIAAIMVLTVVDVTRRATTDQSIQGVVEVAPLLLLAATALGLGYAEQTLVHVRTSMVTSRLPRLPRLVLRAVGQAAVSLVFTWVAWASLDRAVDAVQQQDVTPGFVALPTWPALVLVPLGFAFWVLHLVLRLADDVVALATGGDDPRTEQEVTA